jgi:parvulin-like peptidyl-prolyl isomerase
MAVGCGEAVPDATGMRIATVGDKTINVGIFLNAARVRSQAAEFPRSGAGFEALRDRLVQELIVEEVLLAEAATRSLTLTLEEVAEARAASAEAIVGEEGGEAELQRLLTERFGDPAIHEQVLRRRLLVSKVEIELRKELREGIGVTDEQVAAARERYVRALIRPARVHCRQLFMETAEVARDVRRRLTAGEPFEALAMEHNGTDGDMGWVAQSSMPLMLAKAIEGLPVGRVSKLVRSPLGHHLFLLLGRSPAMPLPEDEAREVVVRYLIDETVDVRFRSWVGARSEDLSVAVEQKAVAALRCCRQGLPYFEDAGSES